MSASAVTQKPAKNQQVAARQPQEAQYARDEKEASASASASAGVITTPTSALWDNSADSNHDS